MTAFTVEFLRDLVYSQPPVPESDGYARAAVFLAVVDQSVLDEAA